MAITIYKSPDDTVTVINSDPPADQSALVGTLQAQVVTLTTANSALVAKLALVKSDVDKAETDVS